MSALKKQIDSSIRLPLLIGMASLTLLLCSPALSSGSSAYISGRDTAASPPATSAALPDSASPSPAPNSQQTVEDASDIWYWNAEIIRRYHKASGTWTYYRAPVVYSRLEVKWDSRSREAVYFLDGNRISADDAHKYTQPGSGFSVGSKTLVGDPGFTLCVSHEPPADFKAGRSWREDDSPIHPHLTSPLKGEGLKSRETGASMPEPDLTRLRNRYRQKYQPDFWQFTALAATRDFVWVAIRSIPRSPESLARLHQPDGFQSERHFRESPLQPIQGGILRIDKNTGEWARFTDKNGLPDALICTPVKAESAHLPHFLPSVRFPQEVVAIVPDEKTGRVAFTTRSNRQIWYDERHKQWERGDEEDNEP
ncbi:MAG: hypothetical protein AB1611_21270 [bacterium]